MRVLPEKGLTVGVFRRFILPTLSLGAFLSILLLGSDCQAKSKTTAAASIASQPLSAGKLIQRSVFIGSRHAYRFRLAAGQYLHVIAEAENIDLRFCVFDASRKQVFSVNSRRLGPTPISLIADAPGLYQLEVQAVSADAHTGRYRLRTEVHPVASPIDKDALEAEKRFAEGEDLASEGKPNSLPSAISKYEEAIEHWRNAGRLEEMALAARNISEAYVMLGQNERALDYYNQLLQLSQVAGNRRLEVDALNGIGFIENDRGAPDITLNYCHRAKSLSQEIAYRSGEAQALNNIGLTSYNNGDMREALRLFEQSLALWGTATDQRGQAQTMVYVGNAYADLGEMQKAISYYQQALSLARKIRDYRSQVLSLAGLGIVYTWLGEKQNALDGYHEALEIAQRVGDRFGQAVSLNGIGFSYDELGRGEKALDYYHQAAQLFKDMGSPNYEAITMGYAAHIYFELGNVDKALEYYQGQLAIARSLPSPRLEAYSLRDIGAVLASEGKAEEALSHYESALTLSQQAGDSRGQAYILNRLGLMHEKLARHDQAQSCYGEALQLMQAVEDGSGQILTLYNLALLKRGLGELTEASNLIQTALGMIERTRANVISEDLRTSYLASVYQGYELYIDLLMQMHKQNPTAGYELAAFIASERGRARNLLEMLTQAHADIRRGISPDLLQQMREFQQLLNAKTELHTKLLGQKLSAPPASENGNQGDDEIATVASEIKELTRRVAELEAEVRARHPKYAALMQPEPLSPRQLAALLDSNTALLEYSLGDERSYVWVVTKSSVTGHELPSRKDIEQIAQEFYQLIAAPPVSLPGETFAVKKERLRQTEARLDETARQLRQMILDPIAPKLRTKRLVVVADGALQSVPFAALPDPQDASGKTPLVVNHEISSLPSLATLAVIRKEFTRQRKAAKTLVVLADPVYDQDDDRVGERADSLSPQPSPAGKPWMSAPRSEAEPAEPDAIDRFHRLPFARREAMEIAQFIPNRKRKLALDFKASRPMAMSDELSKYRIIHFAAHGFFHNTHPERSGIVLSLFDTQGHRQDGFLRLNEVYNMKLRADLVVLSACQTALGKEIKGEGLIGLTRGFMYAGAARVSATLWKVDDQATAQLMKQFYGELLTRKRFRAAAALRAAQLQMMSQPQWKSPYFWAAFTLQGEW
jgi:Uncharacterized protein conserved in bacteria